MYVYIQSEKPSKDNDYLALYTVGYYQPAGVYAASDGPCFIAESDWQDKEKACDRVCWLNGGAKPKWVNFGKK